MTAITQNLRYLFRTLAYRNYRLFFLGQIVALTGTWMTLAAMGWLVFRLTEDPFKLGLIGFFMHAPTFILAPLGGALTDRLDRRRLIVYTQILNLGIMVILAGVTLFGFVQIWHILLACTLLGVVKGFEMPARQALVVDIVDDRSKLSNAIALNSSIFHAARLAGPMIAGGLIIPLFGNAGEGVCFLIHGLSYLVSIAFLLALQMKRHQYKASGKNIFAEMREGFAYAFGFPPVRTLLLLMGVLALFGMPYGTLLPVFAAQILDGGSRTYGLLLSAGGIGAVFSAIYLASRPSALGLGRIIALSQLLFSIMLASFAFSTHLWLSAFLLVLTGGTSLTAMVGTNTILQTLVDDERRGRLMSLMGMTFMGALPVGAILFGKAASFIGAPITLLLGATVCGAAGLVFAWRLPALRRIARPIYIERGLLPQKP